VKSFVTVSEVDVSSFMFRNIGGWATTTDTTFHFYYNLKRWIDISEIIISVIRISKVLASY
jgi:hypothetical protein